MPILHPELAGVQQTIRIKGDEKKMVEKKLNIEIARVKQIPEGYSILAKCEGLEKGFSFTFEQNKHQKGPNGEPLYVEDIRKQFRQLLDRKVDDDASFKQLEKNQGKTFNE